MTDVDPHTENSQLTGGPVHQYPPAPPVTEYRWTPSTMHAMLTDIERRIGTDMHLATHDAFQQGRRAAFAEIGEVFHDPAAVTAQAALRAHGVPNHGDPTGPGQPWQSYVQRHVEARMRLQSAEEDKSRERYLEDWASRGLGVAHLAVRYDLAPAAADILMANLVALPEANAAKIGPAFYSWWKNQQEPTLMEKLDRWNQNRPKKGKR